MVTEHPSTKIYLLLAENGFRLQSVYKSNEAPDIMTCLSSRHWTGVTTNPRCPNCIISFSFFTPSVSNPETGLGLLYHVTTVLLWSPRSSHSRRKLAGFLVVICAVAGLYLSAAFLGSEEVSRFHFNHFFSRNSCQKPFRLLVGPLQLGEKKKSFSSIKSRR